MDYLDSLDLDVSNKRSHRVRAWYMYEQLKSLEGNQRDAARALKARSYQDQILRQELSERNARRRLYDQHSYESNSLRSHSIKSDFESSVTSIEDVFESCRDMCEPEIPIRLHDLSDACSREDLITEFPEEPKDPDEAKDDLSDAGSDTADSVLVAKSDETITDRKETEQEFEKREHLFQGLDLDFDSIKKNLESLEKITEMPNDIDLYDLRDMTNNTNVTKNNLDNVNNPFLLWSKLVAFAYHIMQLNLGNCYYDYAAQFSSAVLACDVIWRGFHRMCHILQPYVSPIASVTDYECPYRHNLHSKKRHKHEKTYLKEENERFTYSRRKLENIRKYWSTENCGECSRYLVNYEVPRKHGASEPWWSKPLNTDRSSHSYWRQFSGGTRTTTDSKPSHQCSHKVKNPMLKLSPYMDRMILDINDSDSLLF